MEEGGGYVSCIRINGKPILPPVMTDDLRRECIELRDKAVAKEAKLRSRQQNRAMALKINEFMTGVKSRLSVSQPQSQSCPQLDLLDEDISSDADSEDLVSDMGPKSFEEIRRMMKEQKCESLDSARSTTYSSVSDFSPRRYEPAAYSDAEVDHGDPDNVGEGDGPAGVYDSMISLNTVVENTDAHAHVPSSPDLSDHLDADVEEIPNSEGFRSRSGSYTLDKPSPLLRAHLMKFGDTSELDMSSHQRTPSPSTLSIRGTRVSISPKVPRIMAWREADPKAGNELNERILSPVPQNRPNSELNRSPRDRRIEEDERISRPPSSVISPHNRFNSENKENSPVQLRRSTQPDINPTTEGDRAPESSGRASLTPRRTLTPSWFPREHLDVALSPFLQPDSVSSQLKHHAHPSSPRALNLQTNPSLQPGLPSDKSAGNSRASSQFSHSVQSSTTLSQLGSNSQPDSNINTSLVYDSSTQNPSISHQTAFKSPVLTSHLNDEDGRSLEVDSDHSVSLVTSNLESAITSLAESHQKNLLKLLEKQEKERQALRLEFEARQRVLISQIVEKFPNLQLGSLEPAGASQATQSAAKASNKAADKAVSESQPEATAEDAREASPDTSNQSEEAGRHNDTSEQTDKKNVKSSVRVEEVKSIPEEVYLPRYERGWLKLTALARGFLVRRLLATEKVQFLKRTIRETVTCAVKLHLDVVGPPSRQDLDLHQRLMVQLDSACLSVHHIFFDLGVPERMAIIALDRAASKSKAAASQPRQTTAKMSAATIARLKSKEKKSSSPPSFSKGRKMHRKRRSRSFSKDRKDSSTVKPSNPSHTLARDIRSNVVMKNNVPKRPAWK